MGALERGVRHIRGRRAVGIAGIGDERIQPAESGQGGGDQRFRGGGIGKIAGQHEGFRSGCPGGGRGGGEAGGIGAGVQGERVTGRSEPTGERGADPGGSAGDEGGAGQAARRRIRPRPIRAEARIAIVPGSGVDVGADSARLVTHLPPV